MHLPKFDIVTLVSEAETKRSGYFNSKVTLY